MNLVLVENCKAFGSCRSSILTQKTSALPWCIFYLVSAENISLLNAGNYQRIHFLHAFIEGQKVEKIIVDFVADNLCYHMNLNPRSSDAVVFHHSCTFLLDLGLLLLAWLGPDWLLVLWRPGSG